MQKNRQNFKTANTSIAPKPQPLSPPTFFSKPQLSRSNQLKWDLMHRVQFFSTQHLVFRSLYCALFVNISLRKLQLGWRNTCLSTLKLVASNNASNNVATDGQGPNLVRSQKTKKIGVRWTTNIQIFLDGNMRYELRYQRSDLTSFKPNQKCSWPQTRVELKFVSFKESFKHTITTK